MLKKLDDIVQTILVQRATPDWLPFVPGSSFWVPPRLAPLKVTDLVGKLADQLTDEESLSVATDRGWPCSQFFVHGMGFFFYFLFLFLSWFMYLGNIFYSILFYGIVGNHKELEGVLFLCVCVCLFVFGGFMYIYSF